MFADHLQLFLHRVSLVPRHQLPCHPCAREKLSPMCPEHTGRFSRPSGALSLFVFLSGGSRSMTRFTTGYLPTALRAELRKHSAATLQPNRFRALHSNDCEV